MSRLPLILLACLCDADVRADVSTTFNRLEWRSIVESYSTIDFTGFPNGNLITNQYADVGVAFGGPAFISGPSPGYANDGWGLHGPLGIHVYFDKPQSWIAIDHAGTALFKLYYQGIAIGTSGFDPVGGIGSFLGIVSTEPFDEVFITTQPLYGTHVFVDDLHWGAPIPAPGALGLFVVAGVVTRRSRRA